MRPPGKRLTKMTMHPLSTDEALQGAMETPPLDEPLLPKRNKKKIKKVRRKRG